MNSFADEYVAKLSETTGVSAEEIREMEREIVVEVQVVLDIAKDLEPSGRLTKRILTLILKERDYLFV
jgi:hypothetical protein